nr:YutD family protein [Periweissella fabalis]
MVNGLTMNILRNYRDAFDELKFKARFSDILTKYDYIIGDIAANQLRLKGFYAPENKNMTKANSIDALEDYLFEYINFGAPYFVIQNQNPVISKTDFEMATPSNSTNRRRKKNNRSNHQNEVSVAKEVTHKPTSQRRTSSRPSSANKNSKNGVAQNSQNSNNKKSNVEGQTNKRRRRRPNQHAQRADIKEVKKPIGDGVGVKKSEANAKVTTKKPNQRKRHFTIQQKNEK